MAERRTNAERRATTRAELFRLGLQRFPVKGYTLTTVDDVLRDSGMSRGAFYFHFASKEAYFAELLRYRVRDRGTWWDRAGAPEHETLEQALRAVFALTEAGPRSDVGAVWVMIIAEFAQTVRRVGGPLAEEVLAMQRIWESDLAELVKVLQARGFARLDRPAPALADAMLSVMDGFNLGAAVWSRDQSGLLDALVRLLRR